MRGVRFREADTDDDTTRAKGTCRDVVRRRLDTILEPWNV
jgi:hypothetical protein